MRRLRQRLEVWWRKLPPWLRTLKRSEQVALASVVVALLVGVLGVVPAYLTYFYPPAPKASASDFAQKGQSGPTTSSSAAKATDGFSITINSNADAIQNVGGSGALNYLIPSDRLSTLAPRPANGEFVQCYGWAHSQGGEDEGYTVAEFTITAQSVQVVAESIQLEVLAITNAPSGQQFSCGGGDILPGRFLDVILNTGHIDFYYGSDVTDYIQHSPFGILVKPGGAEKVQVLAHFKDESGAGQRQLYTWHLKLNILVNGIRYVKIIDNDGSPFITAT